MQTYIGCPAARWLCSVAASHVTGWIQGVMSVAAAFAATITWQHVTMVSLTVAYEGLTDQAQQVSWNKAWQLRLRMWQWLCLCVKQQVHAKVQSKAVQLLGQAKVALPNGLTLLHCY